MVEAGEEETVGKKRMATVSSYGLIFFFILLKIGSTVVSSGDLFFNVCYQKY